MLFRDGWWRLTTILGYDNVTSVSRQHSTCLRVRSDGDIPKFWVISSILVENCQIFYLYRNVWWSLINIFFNIVISGGNILTFFIISRCLLDTYQHFGLYRNVWWSLTNIFLITWSLSKTYQIFSIIVNSVGVLPIFFYIV